MRGPAMTQRRWVRAGSLAFLLVTDCSSRSPSAGRDSGTPDVASPRDDASLLDATVQRDGNIPPLDARNAPDTIAVDAAPLDATTTAPDGKKPTQGCYAVSGTGASQRCAFTTLQDAGACGGEAGTAAGSCPTASLEGCCLKYAMAGDTADFKATCYYNSEDAGQSAESVCEAESYQDDGQYAWDTTVP